MSLKVWRLARILCHLSWGGLASPPQPPCPLSRTPLHDSLHVDRVAAVLRLLAPMFRQKFTRLRLLAGLCHVGDSISVFFGDFSLLRQSLQKKVFHHINWLAPSRLLLPQRRTARFDVSVKTMESVCLVTVELTPHTYAHLRKTLCFALHRHGHADVPVGACQQKCFSVREVSSQSCKFRHETSYEVWGGVFTSRAIYFTLQARIYARIYELPAKFFSIDSCRKIHSDDRERQRQSWTR